ncbi:antitoxin Xre/MbcA/ParS toxin-binding domain-containing protein [Ramlibacter humi]|nr:antitoxin Xre/MbcA/ParS toxin-binding domain-containing protein [Ramlibacter humi]
MTRKTPPTAAAADAGSPRRELWDLLTTHYPPGGAGQPRPASRPAAVKAAEPAPPGEGRLQFSARMAHWIARHGVPAQALEPLQAILDVGRTELAPLLGMDRATVRRYLVPHTGEDEPLLLPPHTSETVLRLAELEALAQETFETGDGARKWLKTPHPMLDGETPLQAASTSYGAQRVREILVAITHGGVA